MSDPNVVPSPEDPRAATVAKVVGGDALAGAQVETPDWIAEMFDPKAPNPGEANTENITDLSAYQTPGKAAEVRPQVNGPSKLAEEVAKNTDLSQRFGAADFNIPPAPKQ